MFSLSFLMMNIKAIGVAIVGIIMTLLGLNYLHRGNKIRDLENTNKLLKAKNQINKNKEISNEDLHKKEKTIDESKLSDIANKLDDTFK